MEYKVVYDFAEEPIRLFPFIFLVVFLFCLRHVWRQLNAYPKKDKALFSLLKKEQTFGAIVLGTFCLFLAFVSLNMANYIHTKKAYRTGQFQQTLGYVSKFKETRSTKYNAIQFTLNGLNFVFADNGIQYGCGYGGVSHAGITDASLLRLYYIPDDGTNTVLRIEKFR